MRFIRFSLLLLTATFSCAVTFAGAQTTAAKAAPISCSIRRTPATEADMALSSEKYKEAVALYKKDSEAAGEEGERAHNGLIRSELYSGKSVEAGKDAADWFDKNPQKTWAMDAVAIVALRAGEIDKAGDLMRSAIGVNFCNAQTHADYARYLSFTGYSASAKSQLEIAHKLDPIDQNIASAWARFQPRSVQAATLDAYIKQAKDLKADERKTLEEESFDLKAEPQYPCTLVDAPKSLTVPFHAIRNGIPTNGIQSNVEWGLAVSLDGKMRRLEIDSGAHGIILTHAAAVSMGLNVLKHAMVKGVDAHSMPISIAKVHDIKINGLEFHDCAVQVFDHDVMVDGWNEARSMMEGQDGLIGSDVFQNYLVTLDFPGRVMKLDPLPQVPTQTAAPTSVDTGGDTITQVAHDRYIDPSMSTWVKAFREEHELFIPVRVNNGPVGLFLVDTGAGVEMVSTETAKRVGTLEKEGSPDAIIGVSGEARKIESSGALTLDFAGLRQPVPSMDAMNLDHLSSISRMSGILGHYTLHQLTIQIDYRDQLIKFTFDPQRVAHCRINATLDDCYGTPTY